MQSVSGCIKLPPLNQLFLPRGVMDDPPPPLQQQQQQKTGPYNMIRVSVVANRS